MPIAWHLEQAGLRVPSTATIRWVLHAVGLVTPEPRKRPRSSCRRFEAAQPSECWQSDFTHWALDGGADAEIINWLDDHPRYLLACTAWAPVTDKVVDTFLQASNAYGLPASTLTDNGRACTARFGGGRNAFEYLLAALAVTDTATVTVIELRTGEVLSVHDIDPACGYWRNKQRSPGRWPGLSVT